MPKQYYEMKNHVTNDYFQNDAMGYLKIIHCALKIKIEFNFLERLSPHGSVRSYDHHPIIHFPNLVCLLGDGRVMRDDDYAVA